jgi:hypothetical protein
MRRRALFIVAFAMVLASAFAGCGGAGETCDPDAFGCDAVPVVVDTPEPTDPPANEPPGPPQGCVQAGDVELLYPYDRSSLSSYASTVYVSFAQGVDHGWFLAVDFVLTQPGQTVAAGNEVGTQLQDVTGTAPPYVPAPDSWFDGVFASSNLALPPGRNATVVLVDTRTPAQCAPIRLAEIDTTTGSVRRLSARHSVRASVSRANAVRGGRP